MARTRLALVFCAIAWQGAACTATPPATTPSTGATSAAPAPALGESGKPPRSTPPSISTFSDILASERGPLDACYAAARVADPRLGQTSIGFSLEIDAAGKPITVDLQYRHRVADSAKDCMRDASLALSFPPSMQGRQTTTLTFQSAP